MSLVEPANRYWALVPAAGGGSRMELGMAKQYALIHGRSMLEWSLSALLASAWIDGVAVVLAEDDRMFKKLPVSRHPKLVTCGGGSDRSESVARGLELIGRFHTGLPSKVFVPVHDAARPGLNRDDLERLRDQASDENGGLLAIPAIDTLKRAGDGRVTDTVDRSLIWRAQTPQMFRLDLLQKSIRECKERNIPLTDESSAMEACGYQPCLVRGRERIMKVTYPEDLQAAEFWLGQEGSQG